MDNEMRMMFNAILEEMDRMEKRMDQRFERMEGRLEQLQHEVNACKLERESISMLIRHMDSLEEQFESLKSFNQDGNVTLKELAESMGTTEKTVRNRIKEHGGFWVDDGNVGKK